MTPEGKIKSWLGEQYKQVFPGHWRVSPRGGPFGKGGCPDHLICWFGVFIAIEVKADQGTVSDLQMAQLRLIIQAGGVAAVVRGRDLARLYTIQRLAITKMNSENAALAAQALGVEA